MIAAGVALNWSWLVAIGVAPLLLTALPCMVMCAVGVCMMPKTEKSIESNSAEIGSNRDKCRSNAGSESIRSGWLNVVSATMQHG